MLNRRRGLHLYRGFESPPLRYTDDKRCQKESKSTKNKEVTTDTSLCSNGPQSPSEVPTDDSTNTIKVTSSDKLDNKLSNKPTKDTDLAEIIEVWPQLPSAIRSAIVAIVRASKE